MRVLSSLASQATPWAFLSGMLVPFVIIAFYRALEVNLTNAFFDYSAFAMLAALITTIGYWVSRAHAASRPAVFTQTPPAHA
jgi:hypothetical protein